MEFFEVERLYQALLAKEPLDSLAALLDLSKEAEISYYMNLEGGQDPLRFRARFFALKVAKLLIDENGEFHQKNFEILRLRLKEGSHLLGDLREGDSLIFSHLAAGLKEAENKEFRQWIKKFSLPLCHRLAENLVRETLYPDKIQKVETFHVRRAVVAAFFTYLRQATGSCFATAPAFLIQKGQPNRFFKDLYDLLSTGQMKRVVEGREWIVPLSPTLQGGDLYRKISKRERAPFSPGLIGALEAASAIPSEEAMEKKIGRLSSFLQTVKVEATYAEAIESLLMKHFDLSLEEIQEEKALKAIQIHPRVGQGYFYQRPTERALKIAKWEKGVELAKSAFWATTECALLRAWEYSLASFSDVKLDFTRWNLYIGVGLHPDQKGGVADFIYQWIGEALTKLNNEIQRLHQEYEHALNLVRTLETLLSQSYREDQRHRFKGELASAMHTANTALEMRNSAHKKGESLAAFFPSLIEQYDAKLQEYFQEVFDPSVAGSSEELYEDSPAGFRLLYKHGRAHAALWTYIYEEKEYINALSEFFRSVEREILLPEGLEEDFFAELTTALLNYLQEPKFLKSSFERAQKTGRKSPWDYVSGGTMQNLVQAYYGRVGHLTEISWLPKTSEELLSHLLQVEEKKEALLMHSPTHAFLFRPDLLSSDAEEKVKKCRAFVAKYALSPSAREFLADKIGFRLEEKERPLFLHRLRSALQGDSLAAFREAAMHALGKNTPSLIDSVLYESLPILEGGEGKRALYEVLQKVSREANIAWEKISPHLREEIEILGAYELKAKARAIIMKALLLPYAARDWEALIERSASSLGFCYPYPILFADTNWSDWFFGFIVNPGTQKLELWRLSRTGARGFPMAEWADFLSSENQLPWVLLPKKGEYT